jgi:hypothetical protein
MKDRNGTTIKIGDTVDCNSLEFTIKSFHELGNGNDLACGEYGDINVNLLEKVETKGEKA